MIHRGKIVEKIVRKSGYSLTKLASELGISLRTLYNRFDSADVSWYFINDLGKIIHYDFTLEFPELKANADPSGQNEIIRLAGKYDRLVEKYNKLLNIVMQIADANGLTELQQEIASWSHIEDL